MGQGVQSTGSNGGDPVKQVRADTGGLDHAQIVTAQGPEGDAQAAGRRTGDARQRRKEPKPVSPLAVHAKAAFEASGRNYGSRRLSAALRANGLAVSRYRARQLMRSNGLQARWRRKFVHTTDSHHEWPVAGNVLARRFKPARHESVEVDRLSDREKEVLRMVASGYTSAEIATNLLISGMTVNTHIRNIYRKLQVRTRAQAVRFASLRGLF